MTANEQLRALLQAERAVVPPKAAAELGWKRLGADIAANVAPLPVATGPLKVGLWLVPHWILAGFAVGLVGASAVAPLLKPSAALGEAKPAVVARAVAPVGAQVPTLGAASAAALIASDSPAVPTAPLGLAPMIATSGARASASAETPTFDAELALISQAKTTLDANDLRAARALLTQHAERFPRGVFAVEREALLALSDCQRQPRNESAFRRFAAQHPSSPLLARLERACQSASLGANTPIAPSSTASFATLPNGSPLPGERTSEPEQGEAK